MDSTPETWKTINDNLKPKIFLPPSSFVDEYNQELSFVKLVLETFRFFIRNLSMDLDKIRCFISFWKLNRTHDSENILKKIVSEIKYNHSTKINYCMPFNSDVQLPDDILHKLEDRFSDILKVPNIDNKTKIPQILKIYKGKSPQFDIMEDTKFVPLLMEIKEYIDYCVELLDKLENLNFDEILNLNEWEFKRANLRYSEIAEKLENANIRNF